MNGGRNGAGIPIMRIVADTNIYISAFPFGGLPRIFLEFGLGGAFSLATSHPLLEELDEKLKTKFAVPNEKRGAFLAKITSCAEIVSTLVVLNDVPDDPDDNRVLECAVDGRAYSIVTGDRHLLRLGSYAGIPIVTVRSFLQTSGLAPF